MTFSEICEWRTLYVSALAFLTRMHAAGIVRGKVYRRKRRAFQVAVWHLQRSLPPPASCEIELLRQDSTGVGDHFAVRVREIVERLT
jgi:hypothetical protein